MSSPVKNAITESGSLSGLVEELGGNLVKDAIGAISPLNNFSRYMTGSRAVIKLNDRLFGFAFAVSFNIETPYEENRTIDDPIAFELIPTRISVSGTLGMFHVPGKGPTKQLIQANILSYLMHRYITIEITDQMTGQLIFKTNKAMITGRQQNLQAGELSTIVLTWRALGFVDEMIPATPTSPSDSIV